MKPRYFRGAAVLVCAFLMASLSLRAAVLEFDLSTDYTSNWVAVGGTNPLSYSASIGADGSPGRLDIGSGSATSVYQPMSFDLNNGNTYSISTFFLGQSLLGQIAATLNSAVTIGFVNGPGTAFDTASGTAFMGVNVINTVAGIVVITPQQKASTATSGILSTQSGVLSSGLALTGGNWYKLTTTWTYAGSNVFNYTANLTDYGTSGLLPVLSIASVNGSFTNPAFAADDTAYVGLKASTSSGAISLDNVEIVPEPGTVALLVLGLGALILLRAKPLLSGAKR
jgi:hypothetical protein